MDRNDSLEPVTTNFEEFKTGSRYAKIVNANNVINPENQADIASLRIVSK